MKKSFINAFVIDKTGTVHTFLKTKVLNNGTIKLGTNTFEITTKNSLIYKGLKTYIYAEDNNMPLNPDLTKGVYSSEEYTSGLVQTVLDKLLASLKGNAIDLKNLFYIVFGIGLVLIIGLSVYFYFDLKSLIESVRPVITTTTTGGIM